MADLETERRLRRLEDLVERLTKADTILDDSGSYSPTYLGGTTAGTTGYAVNGQVGHWVRFGVLVFFYGRIEWTSATGTGNAQISIPFTAASTTNLNYSVAIDTNNVTFAAGTPQGQLSANTAFFVMRSPATNAGSTTCQIEAAGIVNFSGFFEVTP